VPIDNEPEEPPMQPHITWLEPIKDLRGAPRVREELAQWTARAPSPFGALAVATRLWRRIAQARGFGRR
jgi:ferric-dicitrate binding protein FerR (iron transport regulator)